MCWSKKTKTNSGLKISTNKVPGLPDKTAHDRAVDVLVLECARLGGMDAAVVKKALKGVTIEWWDRIAPRPSTGELNTVVVYDGMVYSGLTIGRICKVAWRGKIYRSAFCHELLHIISGKVLGDSDAAHANDLLWQSIAGSVKGLLQEEDI